MYDYQSTSGKAHSGLIVIHNEERIMHRLACRVNLQGMNPARTSRRNEAGIMAGHGFLTIRVRKKRLVSVPE